MDLQRVAQEELRSQFPEAALKRRDSHRKGMSYMGEDLESEDENKAGQEVDFGLSARRSSTRRASRLGTRPRPRQKLAECSPHTPSSS